LPALWKHRERPKMIEESANHTPPSTVVILRKA